MEMGGYGQKAAKAKGQIPHSTVADAERASMKSGLRNDITGS